MGLRAVGVCLSCSDPTHVGARAPEGDKGKSRPVARGLRERLRHLLACVKRFLCKDNRRPLPTSREPFMNITRLQIQEGISKNVPWKPSVCVRARACEGETQNEDICRVLPHCSEVG